MTSPVASARPDDAAELTTDDLTSLKARLSSDLDARRRIVAELRAAADALMGQADSDSLLERELAERGAVEALAAIVDIEDALARIDAGTYGVCERCGGSIAKARLEAIPHAHHCVSCPSRSRRLIG